MCASCGVPPDGQDLRIVDPASWRVCPDGQVGEIWLSSDSVVRGYWNRAAETAETFRAYTTDTAEGPFLRTGDLGVIADGHLYVTGRIKELIIVNGVNHYPSDIEASVQAISPDLRRHAGAAFAREDGRPVIVQAVNRSVDVDELSDLLAEIRRTVWREHEVAPAEIALVNPGEIAKTSSGKIRAEIRARSTRSCRHGAMVACRTMGNSARARTRFAVRLRSMEHRPGGPGPGPDLPDREARPPAPCGVRAGERGRRCGITRPEALLDLADCAVVWVAGEHGGAGATPARSRGLRRSRRGTSNWRACLRSCRYGIRPIALHAMTSEIACIAAVVEGLGLPRGLAGPAMRPGRAVRGRAARWGRNLR